MSTDGAPPTGGPAGTAGPAVRRRRRLGRRWWAAGIAMAALVVVVLGPLASGDPDGLERVAEDQGFIDRAQNIVGGVFADYAIPGIDDPAVSTILAGLLGLAVVVGLMLVLGRVLARKRSQERGPGA